MIRYVMKEDISSVLSMMEQVKEAFPGYQETEFLEALYKAIRLISRFPTPRFRNSGITAKNVSSFS